MGRPPHRSLMPTSPEHKPAGSATATPTPPSHPAPKRYEAEALRHHASQLLQAGGLKSARASTVAEVLVEGDLLGHDTHGLQLLAPYLNALATGGLRRSGAPRVLAERASVATWDGERLPGPWLVREALAWAQPRAREHGSATVVIRRSHHIACLAAYLEAPARAGLVVALACSDPAIASVAPFGGTRPLLTPNPLAMGYPTAGDPVLIDISSSLTTNGLSDRLHREGRQGEHAWWLDAHGQPTRDPGVLKTHPPGSILPLGGLEAGHKGWGLGLFVEALTGGLAGHGRADASEGWAATVWLQVYDPEAFGGLQGLVHQTEWLAQAVRENPPRRPDAPARLPGARGLASKREQLRWGVRPPAGVSEGLAAWASKLGMEPLQALPTRLPAAERQG